MPEPQELVNDIEATFGPLPAPVVAQLSSSKGYSYEAFVLTRLGKSLVANHHWEWVHGGPGPSFPNSAGGTVAVRTTSVTWLRNSSNTRWIFPGITAVGWSGATHHLDIALISSQVGIDPPRLAQTGAVIECKNHDDSISMGTGREMVGLAAEYLTGNRALRSRYTRVFLVSAHKVTENALCLMEGHLVDAIDDARPFESVEWAAWLARRMRWPYR